MLNQTKHISIFYLIFLNSLFTFCKLTMSDKKTESSFWANVINYTVAAAIGGAVVYTIGKGMYERIVHDVNESILIEVHKNKLFTKYPECDEKMDMLLNDYFDHVHDDYFTIIFDCFKHNAEELKYSSTWRIFISYYYHSKLSLMKYIDICNKYLQLSQRQYGYRKSEYDNNIKEVINYLNEYVDDNDNEIPYKVKLFKREILEICNNFINQNMNMNEY